MALSKLDEALHRRYEHGSKGMTIDDVIATLQRFRAEHGNLPVWVPDSDYGHSELIPQRLFIHEDERQMRTMVMISNYTWPCYMTEEEKEAECQKPRKKR